MKKYYLEIICKGVKYIYEGYTIFNKFTIINKSPSNLFFKDSVLRSNKKSNLITYFTDKPKTIKKNNNLIKKIWREDIYKWESKMKLWLFIYYKYELRDGAVVNTNYSILRK